jgi:hypothetical protein
MFIFALRWFMSNWLSPNPSKVDESFKGALLGGRMDRSESSLILRFGKEGFDVKREETTPRLGFFEELD